MIDTRLRPYVQKIFDLMARPLIAMGFRPNGITLLAAAMGFAASGLTMLRDFPFRMAAITLGALSGVLDILDGTVARATGTSSPLGTFLDLVLDRIVEACFIMAFAFAFPATWWPSMFFLALMILNFSAFLLAGSLFPNNGKKSIHYEGGLVERTETLILFGLMLIFPGIASWLIWIFNILMAVTAVFRFTRIVRYARAEALNQRNAQ